MRKAEQERINKKVIDFINELTEQGFTMTETHRLRTCQAYVTTALKNSDGTEIFILTSYRTVVAFIDGSTCYDVLRYAYGYTATSAQHIAKFKHDYHATETFTYRNI